MVAAIRLRALERAQHYLGVKENPPGSNHGVLIDQWCKFTNGIPGGYAWCAAFVTAMFHEAGWDPHPFVKQPSWVGSWEQAGDDKAGGVVEEVKRPYRGDLVCYSWNGPTPDPQDHIGFVEKVLALPWPRNGWRFYIRTVEGNVDEGVVRRKWRWVDPKTVVFVRVKGF